MSKFITTRQINVFFCLILSSPSIYSQDMFGVTSYSCENLKASNRNIMLNKDIARACQSTWQTNSGIGLAGPYGTYMRHAYNNEATIIRDELGNIIEKRLKAKVIIKDKKGRCKVAFITMGKPYEGGGDTGIFLVLMLRAIEPK